MKKTIIILTGFFVFMMDSIYSQNYYASNQIGGLNAIVEGRAVGDFYNFDQCIAGNFKGTADFDSGPATYSITSVSGSCDIFVKRANSQGNVIWVKQIGGPGADSVSAVFVKFNSCIYVTGTFEGIVDFDPGPATYTLASTTSQQDVFIMSLDLSGNFLWAKKIDGTGIEKSTSLTVNQSGNVLVTGHFNGTVDFDPSGLTYTLSSVNDDAFILNLDASGNFIWAKNLGGNGVDRSNEIVTDASNNIYTTGVISLIADLDPGIATYTLASSGSNYSAFISKLDMNGNFIWAKQIGTGVSNCYSNAIALDGLGNIVTAGNFNGMPDFDPGTGTFNLTSMGNSDMYLCKLDVNGNFIWAKQFGSLSDNSALTLATDTGNEIFFCGYYTGTVDFDPNAGTHTLTASIASKDAFITKIDDTGGFVWTYSVTGSGDEICYATTKNLVSLTSFFITGSFNQNISVSTFSNYTAMGISDAFVLTVSPIIITDIDKKNNSKDINFYPNPVSNTLKLSGYSFTENSIISIYNTLGEKVSSCKPEEINLGDLKNGIYFLHLIEGEKLIAVKKIIKE